MKGRRRVHDICWVNVMTPELERAAEFWRRLFQWTYGDGIPQGHVIEVDGLPAGALMDVAAMPGTPPHIGLMVKVEDAGKTAARVSALGGTASQVWDVMGNGRMAACTDPNGAIFSIWQPLSKDGAECDSEAHGAPTWFETMTTDPDAAVRFYSDLFGWTAEPREAIPGVKYTLLHHGGIPIAGAMSLAAAKVTNVPPHWAISFAVDDVDRSTALAKELGGDVCMAPADIPNVARFSSLRSPQGVVFQLLKWKH